MKRCNNCNTLADDLTDRCSNCGSSDFADMTDPQPLSADNTQPLPQSPEAAPAGNGNLIAGIVGAFLFALIGGGLYFVIYQMGIIAGICGLVTFVLASFGYDLFSRSKNTAIGMIISAVASVAAIYAAEYLCISFEIYQVYKELGITFFDAVHATSEFLKDEELMRAFISDLAFSYIFGGIAVISNVVNAVKARKKAAQ